MKDNEKGPKREINVLNLLFWLAFQGSLFVQEKQSEEPSGCECIHFGSLVDVHYWKYQAQAINSVEFFSLHP